MVVADTLFPHEDIPKMMWKSPDGRTMNQIDHVLVLRRFKTSILSIRSFQEAAADSDHFLLYVDMILKVERPDAGASVPQNKQFDTDKLKCLQIGEEFRLNLHN